MSAEPDIPTVDPEREPEYVGAHSGADRDKCRNWLEPEPDGDCGAPATHTVVMYSGTKLHEIPMCDDCGNPEDVEARDRTWSVEQNGGDDNAE